MRAYAGPADIPKLQEYDQGFTKKLKPFTALTPIRGSMTKDQLRELLKTRDPDLAYRVGKNWSKERLLLEHLDSDARQAISDQYPLYQGWSNPQLKALLQQRGQTSDASRIPNMRRLDEYDQSLSLFKYLWNLQQSLSDSSEGSTTTTDPENDEPILAISSLQSIRSKSLLPRSRELNEERHHRIELILPTIRGDIATQMPRGLRCIIDYTTALYIALTAVAEQQSHGEHRSFLNTVSVRECIEDFLNSLIDDAKILFKNDYAKLNDQNCAPNLRTGLYVLFLIYPNKIADGYGGSTTRSFAARVGSEHLNPDHHQKNPKTQLYHYMAQAESVKARIFLALATNFLITRTQTQKRVKVMESILIAMLGLYPSHRFRRLHQEFQHIATAPKTIHSRSEAEPFEQQRGLKGLNRSLPYLESTSYALQITDWLRLWSGTWVPVMRSERNSQIHIDVAPGYHFQLSPMAIAHVLSNKIKRGRIHLHQTHDSSPHPQQWAALPCPPDPSWEDVVTLAISITTPAVEYRMPVNLWWVNVEDAKLLYSWLDVKNFDSEELR